MLGCLTIENPGVIAASSMRNVIEAVWSQGKDWFMDRYIEGSMFSLIGNSRDEGYFACARKLFMVIMSWRLDRSCANYDIATFSRKVNECLIDNPISMHFHNSFLDVLEMYTELWALDRT